MIRIGKPIIYEAAQGVRLESCITDDSINKEYKIWYEVDKEYSKYLCSELADAFLLAVIPFAVDRGQDIYIDANVSPKLLFNTRNCHIPFYAALLGKKKVSVNAVSAKEVNFKGRAVGTGCSMGIDSLSTIYQHTAESCQPEYRLTHLCLFNSCQFGDIDQEGLEEDLRTSAERSQQLADELGLPFFTVNSNETQLMEDSEFESPQLCPIFTVSCAMAVQKLFKKYIYSSSYNAGEIRIEKEDASHTEGACVPLLGNENLEVVLSDTFKKRTEKTAFIIQNPLSRKYLDVCGAKQLTRIKGGFDWYLEDKTHRNCGWCEKCMRTLLTIEILGRLPEYSQAFDLGKYYKNRNDYIAKVVARSEHDVYYGEIYELMKERDEHIPIIGKLARKFDVKNSKVLTTIWGAYLKKTRGH